jgi:hypothetical protein
MPAALLAAFIHPFVKRHTAMARVPARVSYPVSRPKIATEIS